MDEFGIDLARIEFSRQGEYPAVAGEADFGMGRFRSGWRVEGDFSSMVRLSPSTPVQAVL